MLRVCYVVGERGTGKTTLTSILSYNLFLRNYQVAILDLTGRGQGYFFRLGACDFFALGDGSVNIPRGLLVTLQDIENELCARPAICLHALPLMPGLKIVLSSPQATPADNARLAALFVEQYRRVLDFVFVEMLPPFIPLPLPRGMEICEQVLALCDHAGPAWVSSDVNLRLFSTRTGKTRVILNKQEESLAAATRFVSANKTGVDWILPPAEDVLANATVMEMCKQAAGSPFLQKILPLLHDLLASA
ncbi:hypothetical protein [Desulfurispora thermophila]|uniref:hypothetical protein n=1 Tax=Desulfurispora thermophila TaxID=265470 RepID=UPI000367D7C3|nr:hypothetical protein [Desulfurispora thermophila]